MSSRPARNFLQLIGSAVLSQALLSAGNFAVGLLLIRRTPREQYGYYVLIITAVQLLTALQLAFIQPALVRCLATTDRATRRNFVGGTYREQRRRLLFFAITAIGLLLILWYTGAIRRSNALIIFAAIFAALSTLYREYFRMVLLAYRIPVQALKADIFYVIVLCGGAYLATLTTIQAMTAAFTLGIAAGIGGWLLSRMVWHHEGWVSSGHREVLSEIAPLGTWAVVGAAIHWTFTQGFVYVVAGTLGTKAVATISATRLLLMPVNLMSSGLGSMTFPTVSRWLQHQPVRAVFQRLSLLAAGIASLGAIYILAMWHFRGWVFTYVIRGQFEHRDTLLMLWSAVFLLMAVRDQMLFLPAACGRYRIMAWLTLATAVFSLIVCYVCMRLFGVVGALVGVFAGEAFNILGFITLSLREIALAAKSDSLSSAAP